jgi:multisubunit Na+/H+ antiporter MnhF subunit
MGQEDCRMIELDTTYLLVLAILFLPIVMAIIRVIKGPTAPDRIVGLDTINTIVIVSQWSSLALSWNRLFT